MNQPGAPKGISAVKKYPRYTDERRKGENVEWHRIKAMSLEGHVLEAKKISREVASVLGRWLLFKHLSPLEAEAGRRYAFIMGQFDRYFTEGRRSAKSQSYERAYGADQEIERRAVDGSLEHYETTAKKARKHYDKLQKILAHYADPATGRNLMKDALDQVCCEDIEPPAQYRHDIAAALRHIGHEFGVTVQSRRGRPRKGGAQ